MFYTPLNQITVLFSMTSSVFLVALILKVNPLTSDHGFISSPTWLKLVAMSANEKDDGICGKTSVNGW